MSSPPAAAAAAAPNILAHIKLMRALAKRAGEVAYTKKQGPLGENDVGPIDYMQSYEAMINKKGLIDENGLVNDYAEVDYYMWKSQGNGFELAGWLIDIIDDHYLEEDEKRDYIARYLKLLPDAFISNILEACADSTFAYNKPKQQQLMAVIKDIASGKAKEEKAKNEARAVSIQGELAKLCAAATSIPREDLARALKSLLSDVEKEVSQAKRQRTE
jgi:hypothetical protein